MEIIHFLYTSHLLNLLQLWQTYKNIQGDATKVIMLYYEQEIIAPSYGVLQVLEIYWDLIVSAA